MTIWQ